MSEKVAVIGMGQMGSGMAGRLRESGLDVIGYDVSADQRARLAKDGFQMASGIAEALAGRTLVLTSLPDPKAVTAAWLGADGIVAHAARGTLCIELSTIDPQTMRQVAEAATSSGLAVVDCPVSGSPNEARTGKLILIAGQVPHDVNDKMVGEGDFDAQVEQVFKNLGRALQAVGGSFSNLVKINNYCVETVSYEQRANYRTIRDRFVNTAAPPVSTFIYVPRLAQPSWLFEMDAMAVIDA